jgi:AraC-like DNA-binding protein
MHRIPFVRTYAERELENVAFIWTPVPAYLEQLLNFEFRASPTVLPNNGRLGLYSCSVIGAQTEGRAQVFLGGTMHSFAIFFRPSGLSRLFDIPMNELPNQAFHATSVLGGWIESLREQLEELPSFGDRVHYVEEVLGRRASAIRASDGMHDAADRILAKQGMVSIANTASECGLSLRQFERKFSAITGMSPKRVARVARFQSALEAKVARPDRTWLDIAHELDFHDQMHMIHDFRSLAGDTPGGVLSSPWPSSVPPPCWSEERFIDSIPKSGTRRILTMQVSP